MAYKLTYFKIAGLAESIRFLFSYGGIEFEEVRHNHEEWLKVKATMPFGQIPILEHDGKTINQHIAIARYVAKKVKLVGKDDWEDLEIDAIVDTINDMRQKVTQYRWHPDPQLKESLKEALFKETLPYYLTRFDSIVKNNNGYLAIGKLTWADLYFVSLLKYMNYSVGWDITENYPNLAALHKKVLALPEIKKWVEKRPKSDF